MKNVALFYISAIAMLPNIPSYCGSLGYFLDAALLVSKFHLCNPILALSGFSRIASSICLVLT